MTVTRSHRGRARPRDPACSGAPAIWLCLAASLACPTPARAQASRTPAPSSPSPSAAPSPARPAADESILPDPAFTLRVEASIDRALEHLARVQRPDGAWNSGRGVSNGISALCLLAFLGRGHEPGRGPYRPVVDRAISQLLSTQTPTGLFRSPSPSHGAMYDHGLTTLALVEAYGFVPSPSMRQAVQNALDLIARSQAPSGGWRYNPVPVDADLSVTVMQIVALHAAQNARLEVPKATLDRALAYVRSCAVPSGGFGYVGPSAPGPARTAAGILSMQLLGAFDDPAVDRGLRYMAAVPQDPRQQHFYYMCYYAMQAHFQTGGQAWGDWHPRQRQLLLDAQLQSGAWPAFNEPYGGPDLTYSTAMGALSLEVYLHYLPAYQR